MSYKFQIKSFLFFLFIITSFETGISQSISGIINSYYKATAITYNALYKGYSYSGITLQSIAGLSKGDKVLIIQMKGAAINESNSSSFGNISSIGNAGQYEFSTICGFLNNTIVLSNMLLNTYDASLLQVVRVPVYTGDVTITGTLQAQAWNSSTNTGGVLAFETNGNVIMNADIDASGAGFGGGELFVNPTSSRTCPTDDYYYSVAQSTAPSMGGAPKGEGIAAFISGKEHGAGKQSNGGGGADLDNNGGGGGSNYGAGGTGGRKDYPPLCTFFGSPAAPNAQGGISLSSYGYSSGNNRIFLGGGGGCGEMNNYEDPPSNTIPSGTPGGDGGGIIYLKANGVIGNGYAIKANGAQGINNGLTPNNASKGDGAGGGGAGGTVLLDVTSYSGSLNVEAKGANGDNAGFGTNCGFGPGGGGGGGIIWYAGSSGFSSSVAGGSNGVVTSCSNNAKEATSGANGIVQSGFVEAQGTVLFNCAILPLNAIRSFSGRKVTNSVLINWELMNMESLSKVVLEKKMANGQYKVIFTDNDSQKDQYTFEDISNELPALYRLVVYARNGEKQYSNELYIEKTFTNRFNIFPNPASGNIKIEIPFTANGRLTISFFNNDGKLVLYKDVNINSSQSFIDLNVSLLPPGMYNLRFVWKDEIYSGKILKL